MFSWYATEQINMSLFEAFNTFLKGNQAQLVSFVVALLYFVSLACYFSLFAASLTAKLKHKVCWVDIFISYR